ncbi:MAG: hypothetical protein K2K08_06960 [Paramuribaculum sp.]|nr:hypothetical protein [Paramuribaculum sp.]
MKQTKYLAVIGGILAVLVGISRGLGGLTLTISSESSVEKAVGIGLIVIALWLIVTGVTFILNRTISMRKWLTVGVILFWIDGIVNGFIIFGAPLLSGQLINISLSALILICVWCTAYDRK